MNWSLAEKIADAVLFEGYMLYPYRPSALKNRQRCPFGTLHPAASEEAKRGAEPSSMHIECLLRSAAPPRLSVRLRFLQLQPSTASPEWDDACIRTVDFQFKELNEAAERRTFNFSLDAAGAATATELQRVSSQLRGSLQCSAKQIGSSVFKLILDVRNQTNASEPGCGASSLRRAMLAAHCVLSAGGAQFVSLLDPPESLLAEAQGCRNAGNFPVLAGDAAQQNMMLCSPILLYDYPQVAAESSGDFFDGTEIDEMLTLRVLALTDAEKQEMRSADERTRALLERTEAIARQQLTRSHGTLRDMHSVKEQG